MGRTRGTRTVIDAARQRNNPAGPEERGTHRTTLYQSTQQQEGWGRAPRRACSSGVWYPWYAGVRSLQLPSSHTCHISRSHQPPHARNMPIRPQCQHQLTSRQRRPPRHRVSSHSSLSMQATTRHAPSPPPPPLLEQAIVESISLSSRSQGVRGAPRAQRSLSGLRLSVARGARGATRAPGDGCRLCGERGSLGQTPGCKRIIDRLPLAHVSCQGDCLLGL